MTICHFALRAVSAGVLLSAAIPCPGQDDRLPGNAAIDDSHVPDVRFSIDDTKEISRQLRWREVAIIDSCRVLLWRLDGRLKDPSNSKAANAAQLLGKLRASDREAVRLLIENITLRPDLFSVPHPFQGYVAAEALISIGGPIVANAIVDALRDVRTETELRLFAQVLSQNDLAEITHERLRSRAERVRGELSEDNRETFDRNIARIREWLKNPELETRF